MALGKRLVSFNNLNKHQLVFNFQDIFFLFFIFLIWNVHGLDFRKQHNAIQSISPFLTSFCHVLLISNTFTSNTFISNARLELAKTQANAKQRPGAELSLLEKYSHSSSTLLSKNNSTYSKKYAKQ